jgi:hypothetical protein
LKPAGKRRCLNLAYFLSFFRSFIRWSIHAIFPKYE